jgi:hypothetical protein
MKKLLGMILLAGALAPLAGCTSYAGAAISGDKAIIAKNNSFLFGVFRTVYVCKMADNGVSDCKSTDSP